MSRLELDSAFDNMASVRESAAITAAWKQRSQRLRDDHPSCLDLRYGSRPANRIDFLKAADKAPVLIFLHGGYWHTRSKDDFTFCAEGPLKQGINVALVGYTLAPEATLDGMAQEVRAAIEYLAARLPDLGGDPERIVISGWSAGGQLAAMMLDHPKVKGVLAISGIFDLEPLLHASMNQTLGLTLEQAVRNSPITHVEGVHKPLMVVVGHEELPMLRRQTADYAMHRVKNALPVAFEEIPLANHFTILDELASAEGQLTRGIRQLILNT